MKADPHFRTDIQALRGLAVLLVMLYHSGVAPVAAGYLGVDIFFVISGFLITGIVKRGIDAGTFGLGAFYFRRAKRLLPAAYAAFLATTIASLLLLDSEELRYFAAQLAGAITFTANVVLWGQTGYFDGTSGVKPLLHVWSLSIEEQYYLFLPAALLLIPRRFWLHAMGAALVASLGLCLFAGPSHPSAAFYLLPTRAWEFALGSLGALLAGDLGRQRKWSAALFWPAVLALLAIPLLTPFGQKGSWNIVLVCVATLVVILRRHEALSTTGPVRALARVGDISYSLYLVHWPLFALTNNIYPSDPPLELCVGLLAASFALGYLLYATVEKPFRAAEFRFTRRVMASVLAVSLVLALMPFLALGSSAYDRDYLFLRRANHGLSLTCDHRERFIPREECRTLPRPRLLVWGDSFAMHLMQGLAATARDGVEQATQSACGPTSKLSQSYLSPQNRTAAQSCIAFNESVFAYVEATPTIDVVALSSPFAQFLQGRVWRIVDGRLVDEEASVQTALGALGGAVARLRAAGKRVVIVAPPPTEGWDIGRCLQRKAEGKPVLGVSPDCNVAVEDYRRFQAAVHGFLRRAERELDVSVVSFDSTLCGQRECRTRIDGIPLYRDAGHFSHQGSLLVAKQMNLAAQLMEGAR